MIVQHLLVVMQHSPIHARHKNKFLAFALHNGRFLVLCIVRVLHEHFFFWRQFLRLKNKRDKSYDYSIASSRVPIAKAP